MALRLRVASLLVAWLSRYPILSQRGVVAPADLGIFGLVRNQPATFVDGNKNIVVFALIGDFESERIDPAAVTNCEMARRFLAYIKVLVEPIPWRAIDAAFAPFDFRNF